MLKPLYDQILIEKVDGAKKMDSGLVVPETAGSFIRAIIVAVGHGRPVLDGKLLPLVVQPGDVVLIRKNAVIVDLPEIGAGKYALTKEDSVLAIDPDKSKVLR